MKQIAIILFFPVCLVIAAPIRQISAGELLHDGRDHWSLMDKSPLNRQLHEQLKSADQQFRLWQRPDSRFAFMVDASSGGQQSLPGTRFDQTRYHGFFIFDSYGSVRLFDSLDINLNLNFLNPSFCDGYRKSFQLLGGMSIHFHRALFNLIDSPLIFHALVMDLDTITFGEGLLIEQLPLEGFSFAFQWRDMSLSAQIAARVFWHYDDLLMIPLAFFDGRISLLTAIWYFTTPADNSVPDVQNVVRTSNNVQNFFPYFGVSGHYDWHDAFRISGEYLARVKDNQWSSAALFRADYKKDTADAARIHLGYQFRYYGKQFAPLANLSAATTAPQIPAREDTYVTNSFEYLPYSPWFHQVSHTVMSEVQLNLTRQFQLYYELECWFRWAFNGRNDNRVLFFAPEKRAPGHWQELFYDVGFRYRLFASLPHRIAVFVSNKWVASDTQAVTPMSIRFVTEPLYGFELEVFL
ncbi:MAG: hypothetical protein JXX14_24215 [Deltaproteobacteria bacterium]|nr:hypothetical protein [Deltaproteobacteria bacterium]